MGSRKPAIAWRWNLAHAPLTIISEAAAGTLRGCVGASGGADMPLIITRVCGCLPRCRGWFRPYDKPPSSALLRIHPLATILGRIGLRGMAAQLAASFLWSGRRAKMDLGDLVPRLPLFCYEAGVRPRRQRRTGASAFFLNRSSKNECVVWQGAGAIASTWPKRRCARIRAGSLPMARVARYRRGRR